MAGMDRLGDAAANAVESVLGPDIMRPGMGLFGAILAAVDTAACLIDPRDRVHGWNAKHLEFLAEHNDLIRRGLPYAEILGNYFRHNSSETDPARWRTIVDAAIRRHREMVEPSMFQKKDGRWLLSQIFRFPGGYALKIWTDKTREMSQIAAIESAELSTLSDCGIISFDRHGRFRGANNRAGDIFPDAVKHFHGACRFEVEMLDTIRSNLDPAELDKIALLFERAWPLGETLMRPVVLRKRDGSWLQLEERVLLDGSLSLVWIDITKLLALEATNAELDSLVGRLRVAQADAEAASRAKSQFLAVMSHELRTPLTGVTGMIELLQKTALDAKQLEYVGVLRESADALLAVINDILDFSKIEAGHLVIEQVAFDLPKLIEGAVRLLEARAVEKGLALRFAWPADAPRRITGDPARLRQVLLNLVGNAIKFTDRGRVEIRLVEWQVEGTGCACAWRSTTPAPASPTTSAPACSRCSARATPAPAGGSAAPASVWRSAAAWSGRWTAASASTARRARARASGSRSRPRWSRMSKRRRRTSRDRARRGRAHRRDRPACWSPTTSPPTGA